MKMTAAGLLDADERTAVARHVPWTRQVRDGLTRYQGQPVPLLAFAQRNRERLVLKPNDDYGGQGVLLGWETGPGQLGARAGGGPGRAVRAPGARAGAGRRSPPGRPSRACALRRAMSTATTVCMAIRRLAA